MPRTCPSKFPRVCLQAFRAQDKAKAPPSFLAKAPPSFLARAPSPSLAEVPPEAPPSSFLTKAPPSFLANVPSPAKVPSPALAKAPSPPSNPPLRKAPPPHLSTGSCSSFPFTAPSAYNFNPPPALLPDRGHFPCPSPFASSSTAAVAPPSSSSTTDLELHMVSWHVHTSAQIKELVNPMQFQQNT